MAQQRAHIFLKPVCHKQRDTARREHLPHLMHDALGHSLRARTDQDGQEQLALRVDRRPDPLRRARQTPDGLLFAHLPVLDGTEHGIGVLSTSNRKPPLRSVSPATGVRPSVHSAVFPA